MNDDRFDEVLQEAAREYRRPPATPREEIWARIEASRAQRAERPAEVVELPRRPAWQRIRGPILIAAVLVLGIALGRFAPRAAEAPEQPVTAATEPPAEAGTPLATRVAAVQHLSRVEAWLVDFDSRPADAELIAAARALLIDTRLWIDANRLQDARLKTLLEDLELILTQIVELRPGDLEDRSLIRDGMAERQIRPRLQNAVPVGPTA